MEGLFAVIDRDVLRAASEGFNLISKEEGANKRAIIIDADELSRHSDMVYETALAIQIGDIYAWPIDEFKVIYVIKNKFINDKQNIVLVGKTIHESIHL